MRRLVEYAVFVPVGIASELQRDAGRVVDEGRQRLQGQLTVARAIGELTVRVFTTRLRARLDGGGAVAEQSAEPSPAPAAPTDFDAVEAAPLAPSVPAAADPALPADNLPIEDYESLAASQVVARLPALGVDELVAVERFEQQHRRRRTVLGKIEQLRRSG